jgi:hypothetical protein
VVKLVRRVAACGGAGSPDFFINFRLFLLLVQLRLDGAFYVVAEFSALVFNETFS